MGLLFKKLFGKVGNAINKAGKFVGNAGQSVWHETKKVAPHVAEFLKATEQKAEKVVNHVYDDVSGMAKKQVDAITEVERGAGKALQSPFTMVAIAVVGVAAIMLIK